MGGFGWCAGGGLNICTTVHTIAHAHRIRPDKAAANPLKHVGVTFADAEAVLLAPYALTREDQDETEQRFITLGMGSQGLDFNRGVDVTRRLRAFNFRLESQPTSKEPL